MGAGQSKVFGTLDGVDIHMVTIRSKAGARAEILTWGAVMRDLVVPHAGTEQHVCLGLNSIDDYVKHSPYFGAVPGRFANRIAGGRFTLDGRRYALPCNEGGFNILHGGPEGFGQKVWTIAAQSEDSVTLTLHSPDGDQGFPGALDATCVYTMLEAATLRVDLTATTDAPTVVNLTNHAYFNLDGSENILDHVLAIHAEARTPTDACSIPTGAIEPVAGTPFDFRTPRPIRHPSGRRYDDNFVIGGKRDGTLVQAARATSPKNGLAMDVYTDQPGLQFYDAQFLDCPVPGIGGANYGRHAGFCLETQVFPDAPNHPDFPSSVLRPGERYRNLTEFRFG
jgi:aldose 1-epimerase